MLAYEWTFGSVLWAMIVFFFWFMLIWMFIAVFADIFRRHDIHGGAKAAWIVLIFFVPLLGALIYLIARPAVVDDRDGAESYAKPGVTQEDIVPRFN